MTSNEEAVARANGAGSVLMLVVQAMAHADVALIEGPANTLPLLGSVANGAGSALTTR